MEQGNTSTQMDQHTKREMELSAEVLAEVLTTLSPISRAKLQWFALGLQAAEEPKKAG